MVNYALCATQHTNISIFDPSCYEKDCTKKVWVKAMQEKLHSIEKNDTWELCELPKGKRCVGSKWVYKTKYNSDGTIERHKARLVAKGFTQKHGVDFEETFAPVARQEIVRLLLSMAAQNHWSVYHMDVKSAFLNGYLDEEVFVQQPQGFQVQGKEHHVYKLKKALYGLKQAPRAWYTRIDGYFQKFGLMRSKNEPTLYIKREGNQILLVSLYVDDLIYMGSDPILNNKFKADLMNEFEMKDLGLMRYFLGMEVHQCQEEIFVCQSKYAKDMLSKYGMMNCTGVHNHVAHGELLCKDDGAPKASVIEFRSIVGSLMFLCNTRPDIQFAVSLVSRYMNDPSILHLKAAKRILRYVKGTIGYGLHYSHVDKFELVGFSDSDWGSNLDDRKSTSGQCFSLGSGMITWSSKKQSTVALSSCEAEYIALTVASAQALWLRKLLDEIGEKQHGPTILYCDNQSAIQLAHNPIHHSRPKHFQLKYHFIRDMVEKDQIELHYCNTKINLADIFIKGVVKAQYVMLRDSMVSPLCIKGENVDNSTTNSKHLT